MVYLACWGKGKLNLEASLTTEKFIPLLAPLFAFIKPTLKATGEGEVNKQSTEGYKQTIELETIATPQRQLKQLALYFLFNYSERIFGFIPLATGQKAFLKKDAP